MKVLRDASPQAVHHYTRFDQVNALVSASEADPDRGFMARLLALCSLPRSNPGDRYQYKRVNRVAPRIVRVAAKPTHTRIHCGGSLGVATPRIGRATQPHAAPEQ